MGRVAVVEDQLPLQALIANALLRAGLAVDCFESMAAFRAALRERQYDVLVLDRGLPDGDGLALVRELRRGEAALPSLLLTARDALHDRVDGLNAGADDYLTKPFAMEELQARVQALLRRPRAYVEPPLDFGDLRLDPQQSTLACGEARVPLAFSAVQVMRMLIEAQGGLVERRRLDQVAWGVAEAVTPNALDVVIHRLRRTLRALRSRCAIENLRGKGYRLHPAADLLPCEPAA
jgi:DNA-binding response OmpR family regulator